MRVLSIGINNYLSPRVQDLRGCVNDSLFWIEYFRQNGVSAKESRSKINSRAKKIDIINGLKWLFKKNEQETVVFCYSGHGTNFLKRDDEDELEDEYDEAICPADTEEDDNCITDNEIYDMFLNSDKKTFISIYDSCFSGGMSRDRNRQPKYYHMPRDIQTRRTIITAKKKIENKTKDIKDRTYICISACAEDEVSYDDSGLRPPMGVFTKAAKSILHVMYYDKYDDFIFECKKYCKNQIPQVISINEKLASETIFFK